MSLTRSTLRPASYTCRRCLRLLHENSGARRNTSCRFSSSAFLTTSPVSSSSTPKNSRPLAQSTQISNTTRPRTAGPIDAGRVSYSQRASTAQDELRSEHRKQDFYVTSLGHASPETERLLLRPDNLFHSFTNSPAAAIRRRAEFMKQNAYCPHPDHQRSRQPMSPGDTENRKSVDSSSAMSPIRVSFECPDCGIPIACCKSHWEEDYESHLEICDTLKQINEDDHDLHSGRFFPEFEYPGPQRAEEFVINMSNWDTLLYTRDFPAINEARNMRQVTRLLTYPMTITSVLHELSPYNIKSRGRLTPEGLRSLSALRYTMHPPRMGEGGDSVSTLKPKPPPIRIFILGARAESSLPRAVWQQMSFCFPRAAFHLVFIGPEAMANRDREFPLPVRTPQNPFGGVVEDRISTDLKITTFVDYYHTMHEATYFTPYDPYFDVFMLFHPGLGHPASSHEWAATLPQLLETKCPIICTGYTEWDMERDRKWVEQQAGGEMDILIEPGENIFRSLRWDLNDVDPGDISCGNWGLWAFRGKRYEATSKDAPRT